MTKDDCLKQALALLEEINKWSLPPHSIPLPAEIDEVTDAIKEVLSAGPSLTEQWKKLHDKEIACNPHPDAPHGFDRSGSHCLGRYKCDCEGWVP